MATLALTEDKVQLLVQIETFTKNLESKINAFEIVSPSDTIIAKSLKDEATQLEKMVEEMRTTTVAPYNDFVKQVNAKAKEYSLPIDACKNAIVGKIKNYELAVKAEQDRKDHLISEAIQSISKAESIESVESIYASLEYKNPTIDFVYTQRKNDIAEAIRLAKIKKQQDAEAQRLADIAKTQNAEALKIEQEKQALAQKQRELDDQQAQIEAQKLTDSAIRKIENEIIIPIARTKGISTKWKMEVIDPTLVPREFCDPNEVKIREAMNSGTREIPGVRIFEDIIVR